MTKGVVVGPTQYVDPRDGSVGYCFDILGLDDRSLRRIPMRFLGHGFTVDPKARRKAATFEKKGPGACLLDLEAGKVVMPIPIAPGRHFYGHGEYAATGDVVYVVETILDSRQGRISIRDASTFAPAGEVPTFGSSPHDCVLVDDGRTLVVTNGGGPLGATDAPSVTFVELATGKLLDRRPIPNPRLNAGHLALDAAGNLAVVSAPREGLVEESTPGGVTLQPRGQPMTTMKRPETIVRRMLGESLSVCIHESTGVVVVTNPRGALVTFWSLAERRLLKTWEIKSPRGVTLTADGTCFAVSCDTIGTLALVSTASLERVDDGEFPVQILSGSHIYRYAAEP